MAAKMRATHLVGKSKHMDVDTVNKLVGLLVDRIGGMARRVGKPVVVLEGDHPFKMAKQSSSRSARLHACYKDGACMWLDCCKPSDCQARALLAELELRYPGCIMHTHP